MLRGVMDVVSDLMAATADLHDLVEVPIGDESKAASVTPLLATLRIQASVLWARWTLNHRDPSFPINTHVSPE